MSERPAAVERIASILLAVAATAVIVALVAAIGWYRASRRVLSIDQLAPEARQEIAAELMAVSPGTHDVAWYEPAIGYTLHPDRTLEAWDDRFETNALGYRTGAVQKRPGTFRVLFVGDSWTYGMGVTEAESFPVAVEHLAHARGLDQVEAWTLALPGYNTFNYLSALWYFYDRLEPDAVVIAPTTNDQHSSALVLPNGALTRTGGGVDDFGHEHVVTYRVNHLDSFRANQRWDMAFAAIRDTEQRLAARGVPMMLFFIARWHDALVHQLISRNGIEAPYMVMPISFTLSKDWVNPPPMDHGNAAANRLYGEALYRGLTTLLDWPAQERETRRSASVPLYEHPPDPAEWTTEAMELARGANRRYFMPSWRPGQDHQRQVAGAMAVRNGEIGRAATVLVNRRRNASGLRIAVRRLDRFPSLYPLSLRVTIPSPNGGTRVDTVIPADGPPLHTFDLDIPDDIQVGAALDVVFVAEHAVADQGAIPVPRSLAIRSITPID